MPRVQENVQTAVRTGLNPVYASITAGAGNGIAFDNTNAGAILHIKNGGAGASVATVITPKTVDGLAIPDLTVTVPAGEERFIGPFPKALYNQSEPDTGLTEAVVVEVDVDTSVTLAVIDPGSVQY